MKLTSVLGKTSTELNSSPTPLLFLLATGENPLMACCFLCFFFGTGNGEQFWEESGTVGGASDRRQCAGAKSEQPGLEASLRVVSTSRAFSLMSLSFSVCGLNPLQIQNYHRHELPRGTSNSSNGGHS